MTTATARNGTPTVPQTCVDAAPYYARRGWRVAPNHGIVDGRCTCGRPKCSRSAGKHPRINNWQHEATTNETVIARWLTQFPNSNIGIATGAESGIIVVDVDGDEGLAAFAKLVEANGGDYGSPLEARSGSGTGRHLFYAWDSRCEVLLNWSKADGSPIDIRANGGNIIVAPSLHKSGKRYEWLSSFDSEPGPMPQWLIDHLLANAAPKETCKPQASPRPNYTYHDDDLVWLERRARAYMARFDRSVQGSNGSRAMLKACRFLFWEMDFSEDVARRLLDEYNATAVPPWEGAELEHKIADAQKDHGAKGPRGAKRDNWLGQREEKRRQRRADRQRSTAAAEQEHAPDDEYEPGDAYEGPDALPSASTLSGRPSGKFPEGSNGETKKTPLRSHFTFAPITSAQFDVANYSVEWFVKHGFVRGQFGVMGAASKTMKTSLALDWALSVSTGLPFMGTLDVYKPARVAVISGESGEAVLRETARRIAAAKGIKLADADVLWSFDLPQLARITDLAELCRGLRENKVEALLLDPLYLSLLAGTDLDAKNLYDIGPLLRNFTLACLDAGATPITLHHFKKAHKPGDELSITDLSFSGIAENCRQWLLIGRRERYVPGSGRHALTVEVGGSAGQSGSWSVDIDEGQLADDFTGRKWDLKVTTTVKSREDASLVMAQKQKEKNADKLHGFDAEFLNKLDAIIASGKPATKTAVRDALGWNGEKAGGCVTRLELDGIVETYTADVEGGKGSKKPALCLRRKHHPDCDYHPDCPGDPENPSG
jgi:hypothetical protein